MKFQRNIENFNDKNVLYDNSMFSDSDLFDFYINQTIARTIIKEGYLNVKLYIIILFFMIFLGQSGSLHYRFFGIFFK